MCAKFIEPQFINENDVKLVGPGHDDHYITTPIKPLYDIDGVCTVSALAIRNQVTKPAFSQLRIKTTARLRTTMARLMSSISSLRVNSRFGGERMLPT